MDDVIHRAKDAAAELAIASRAKFPPSDLAIWIFILVKSYEFAYRFGLGIPLCTHAFYMFYLSLIFLFHARQFGHGDPCRYGRADGRAVFTDILNRLGRRRFVNRALERP